MKHSEIDGYLFARMVVGAATHLKQNKKKVDDLNVFPVPDGDTGTNMTLSLTSGVNEMEKSPSPHIGKVAQALSKGLLMGARGNSGVILSQLFRGFGKAIADQSTIGALEFANALQQGVETAYKAVMKPVEGTILTVAKEAAKEALMRAKREKDLPLLMKDVLRAAKEALARTPEQLPILKQVGVVDSGGQGLVFVYEGFLAVLAGEELESENEGVLQDLSIADDLTEIAHERLPAQVGMRPEEIEFGYCTEFIIGLNKLYQGNFDEALFRTHLSQYGDSLLVISDDELVKVHIHAEHPGEVLSYAQQYGDFKKIKIENMREQLGAILDREGGKKEREDQMETAGNEGEPHPAPNPPLTSEPENRSPYALVAVAAGEGLEEIFRSIGITELIRGGQTMNPSTEEIVHAIEKLNADHVFILPNNSNIIMAAEQAKELVHVPVTVIPTKTIPQGIAAAIAFDPFASPTENEERMNDALSRVKTGQITYAVRDSKFGEVEIKEGDYLGIREKEIVISDPDLSHVAKGLISQMVGKEDSILTLITGEGVEAALVDELVSFVHKEYPDLEVERQYGGQPVYLFLFSVE
ncbi:MAG: DAK2 domain-containing protein [Thermicanus sp.]|nr:DAK2 domain-containing protein [Thermicanus sp.]